MRLLLLPSPPLFHRVVRALGPRFTPLRDLSSELVAGVLDLGRWVTGLPPISPFVLREIGGVTMTSNFRIRQVLIRPLYSPFALGRQASPP
jgi:hypothetical protein